MKTEWVLRHKPLIYREAFRFWCTLGPNEKAWLDVDDLFSEAIVHVITQAGKYDRTRGAETTWVVQVAQRRLQDYAGRFKRKRRTAFLHDIDTALVGNSGKAGADGPVVPLYHEILTAISMDCPYFADVDAQKRVLAFFRLASKRAAKYVLYALRFGKRQTLTGEKKTRCLEELRWALDRSGVLAEDFIVCRAALV